VQRTGGLGSEQRFSLQGLENEQVRFFLDGVPLALAGYPFGIGDIPVNLIERVEVYSGVVPIRFGADALGGAVQLVTRAPQPGAHGAASLQTGSFDTVRATLSGSHYDPRSGFLAHASAFGDSTENNYRVTVDVPDAMGRSKPTKVHLFHAGYRAAGINLLTGVTGRSWADRLLVRAFTTAFERELPSDPTMTEPYGAATQDEWVVGGTLRYEHALTSALRVDAIGGYNFAQRHLLDITECIYDWFGRCSSERKTPGEIASGGTRPRDAIYDTHSAFLRANGQWQIDEHQSVALTLAPTYADRTGDERRPNRADQPDMLNAERRLMTFVAGLEHHLQLFDRRLESEVFAKGYSQVARSDEVLRSGERIARDRDTHRAGAGAALRYTIIPELWAKASYEYATRLPGLDEVYGDGVMIEQNLQLRPEVSHNGNLSLASAAEAADGGAYKLEVSGFVRAVDDLIQLLSAASLTQRFANVASARSLGVQAAGSWTSPGGYLWLAANTTYQDFRNRSRTPPESTFFGDRIPNRPYFFATGQARLQLKGVATPGDRIMLTWTTRYTHAFFRTWESLGRENTASSVPEQVVHALSLNYLVVSEAGTSISAGIDLQNLTDARVFDAYGAERPGRAAYIKITAEH